MNRRSPATNPRIVPEEMIRCPRCGQSEFIKKGTREHLATKTKVPLYKCKVCNYRFTLEKAKEAVAGKKHQTGKTSVVVDKSRKAKVPGKRVVHHEGGKDTVYWEFRRNRSDVNPEKML